MVPVLLTVPEPSVAVVVPVPERLILPTLLPMAAEMVVAPLPLPETVIVPA